MDGKDQTDPQLWYGLTLDSHLPNELASSKYTLNTLANVLFGWVYNLVASVIRWFRPYSGRITMQSWSQQQAGFLIQNIVLLAESKGIQTAILNGFSEDKLRTQFHIPQRFQVAAVVCLGYKKEGYEKRQSARFPFGRVLRNC